MTAPSQEKIPQPRVGDKPLKENVDRQGPESSRTQSSKEDESSNERTQPLESMLAPTGIVRPAVPIDEIAAHMQLFQQLKVKLLSRDDVVIIKEKPFIKRSGWRKFALAFNISDEIANAEREDLGEGEYVWRIWVKCTAPNGRTSFGVGSCSTRERESFAHEEHDVYAIAHTRAKNRAISDLIGSGEVSAEEIQGLGEIAVPPKLVEPEISKPSELVVVRFVQDVPQIIGVDLKTHGPFRAEDVASLPRENAEALVKQGLAKTIPSPAVPEPSTFEIRGKDGSQLAIAETTSEGVTIEPTVTVKADLSVFKSFLIQRVLIPLTEKHGGKYRLDADSEGYLTEISLEGLKLDEKLIKELTGAVRWTLERAVEKTGEPQT